MEWGPVSIHRTGGISVSPRGKSSPSDISSVLLLPEASTVPRAGAAAQDLVPEPGISFLAEELMVALTALLPPSSPADWSSAGWASVGHYTIWHGDPPGLLQVPHSPVEFWELVQVQQG